MASNGIDWCQIETDLLSDDEKVFDLMDGELDDAAFALFGRFIGLLLRIYRTGPALEVDARMFKRLAHELGLSVDEFSTFVERCVAAGLLDENMWRESHVLTSHGIQSRWMTAKKRRARDGLYAEFRPYSLLEDEDDTPTPDSREIHTSHATYTRLTSDTHGSREIHTSHTKSQNPGLDKIRREEIRKEEDESKSSSGSESNEEGAESADGVELPCLTHEEEGKVYLDDAEGPHRTRYGALEQRYRSKTGRTDFHQFIAEFKKLCPHGCREGPEQAAICYGLLCQTLDVFDPARGSPLAFVRHVVSQDRGF